MVSICNSIPLPQDQAPGVETHPSCCTRIVAIALEILVMIPLGLLNIVTAVVSLICEGSCSEELQKLADKVEAIFIAHSDQYGFGEKSLCSTKNLPTRWDIWNESDTKLGSKWVEQLQLKHAVKAPRTMANGICLGASISLIKEVQSRNIQNEAELIATVAQYQEGFPVESAALQIAYEAVADEFLHECNSLIKQYKQLPILDQQTTLEEASRLVKEQKRIIDELESLNKDPDYKRIAKVVHLVDLEMDKAKDIEEKGCYCISSKTHAVALLNFDFGTYVVDPNRGLNHWDADSKEAYKNFTQVFSFKPLTMAAA